MMLDIYTLLVGLGRWQHCVGVCLYLLLRKTTLAAIFSIGTTISTNQLAAKLDRLPAFFRANALAAPAVNDDCHYQRAAD